MRKTIYGNPPSRPCLLASASRRHLPTNLLQLRIQLSMTAACAFQVARMRWMPSTSVQHHLQRSVARRQ